jgi:Protein of unknown function (DUF3558)
MALRAAPLLLVIVTAAGLAGCAATGGSASCDPVACAASATQAPDPAAASPSPSPVAASTGPADWWIRVDPCGLLNQAELTRLGFLSPGQALLGDGPGRANECAWGSATRALAITLSGYPYTDLFFHTGQVSAYRFADGRSGELDFDSDGTGGCQLTVESASGSSALIFMTGRPNGPGPRMCPIARRVASLTRPRLPRP